MFKLLNKNVKSNEKVDNFRQNNEILKVNGLVQVFITVKMIINNSQSSKLSILKHN